MCAACCEPFAPPADMMNVLCDGGVMVDPALSTNVYQ
jgi:hypothetical protein